MALNKFLLNPSSHNNINKKVPILIMLTCWVSTIPHLYQPMKVDTKIATSQI